MDPALSPIVNLILSGGLPAFLAVVWWLERSERVKLTTMTYTAQAETLANLKSLNTLLAGKTNP